ncbi:TRAP transporter small permease [Bhargavaea massiliensis]|uniref:TRAP transporter small permease n=1 Tax=Bhargavaea massiliensis TaxID=2697500 RepID=UPI001BCDA245|nr:TRAP transporter small permease [Bhargavaea massiliensis]
MNVLKWLDKNLEEYLLMFLSVFTVVVIFSQVVMRYLFNNSLTWSEEIARYAFIWMIYIGVSYGVKRNAHLAVDILPIMFKEKGKLVFAIIADFFFLIFTIIVTIYGLDIIAKITRESAALEIPMSYVYTAPVAGMGLTIIRLLQRFVLHYKVLRQGKAIKQKHTLGWKGEAA